MRVITIANQKGGAGKTTSAAALAAMLAGDGFRVLCIDLNDQGDFGDTLGAAATPSGAGSIGLFTGADVLKLIKDTDLPRVEVIPAGEDIALLDMKLEAQGRERALLMKKALEPLKRAYDFIVIDAPGSFNTAMLNALAAANVIIIPAQADVFNLKGIRRILANIRQVKATVNPDLQIGGILLTRYQGRRNLSKEAIVVLQAAEKTIGARLFTSKIRENSKVAEAPGHKKTIIEYAPTSNGAADYKAFYMELMAMMKERKGKA